MQTPPSAMRLQLLFMRAQDGVNALALAEAANQSLKEGRTVPLTAEMIGGAP